MKLKDGISPGDFLQCVERCTGEVLYKTREGDILNLKSQLSKYLFLIAVNAPETVALRCGDITYEPENLEILRPFLEMR